MCCVSRQIWKTEQETLAEVVGCSTTDWSTNLLRSTCKKWQICGLQVSQYIKGGTKRAWQHFWVTFSCKALFYRHNPRSRRALLLGGECWVPEIRNVMQSELSNRHARLVYLYRGVATGEREDKETTTQCNVIRVKEPYPAKDDAIFSVLQIHHRWKRRKKKHHLSYCCISECTFSSVFPLATNCPLRPIEESGCQSMTPGLLHTQIGRPLNLKLLLLPLHRYCPGATFHSLAHKLLSWRAKFSFNVVGRLKWYRWNVNESSTWSLSKLVNVSLFRCLFVQRSRKRYLL